jgi:hypothetical protein
MAKNWFEVRVSRVNEGAHDAPYFTMAAHTLTVGSDGSLSITGEKDGRSLSPGLWDGFEFKVNRNA